MKKKMHIILLLVVFSLVWVTLGTGVIAAPNYKKVYGKFLKKGKFIIHYPIGDVTTNLNHFLLLDIDRNGTKELLTYDYDCYSVEIFTIKKGKVKYIGNFFNRYGYNEVIYCKKYKGLITPNGGGGYLGYYMTCLKNGKLYDKRSALIENLTPKRRYLINGKYVSKKKYQKYDKRFFSKKNQKAYYFKNNTAGNRKKLLR